MKQLMFFFFIVAYLSSFGQDKQLNVKFIGDDIEFDKLKVIKIIGVREPEILVCGGVINLTVYEKPNKTKEPQKPKEPEKPKKPIQKELSDTIVFYSTDSLGLLKLASLQGVYYQYKNGCVVDMNNYRRHSKSQSDTIFIEIPKDNNYIIKVKGDDLYYFTYPDLICRNKRLYKRIGDVYNITYSFSKYEVKEVLTYSDSTLEFYNKIKKGKWYHFNDSLPKKVMRTWDPEYIKSLLVYPSKAEKFQAEGLVVFKLILTYNSKISDIELVFGNEPILVTEAAKFLGQHYYIDEESCYVSNSFEHYFKKVAEELTTEIYLHFEFTILKKGNP